MSIKFTINGTNVECKPNELLFDVFEDNFKNLKFQDQVWIINGQSQMVAKNTKIAPLIRSGDKIQFQEKGSQQIQANQFNNFNQANKQQNIIAQPPQSPFAQGQGVQPPSSPFTQGQGVQPPSSPFTQGQGVQPPSSPFQPQNKQSSLNNQNQNSNQQPNGGAPFGQITFQQANKAIIEKQKQRRQVVSDKSGSESISKSIKGYNVYIKDYGKTVILEQEDGSFKATFLEQNASEEDQDKIHLSFNDIIQQQESQVKLAMGQDQNKSTKVLFLTGYRGIAIRWVTGLQTKFEFWIDE